MSSYSNQILKGIYLDPDTEKMLAELAEMEAAGERVSESRTVRRLIREKAAEMGLFKNQTHEPKTKKATK